MFIICWKTVKYTKKSVQLIQLDCLGNIIIIIEGTNYCVSSQFVCVLYLAEKHRETLEIFNERRELVRFD